ncbi:retrotransposon-like protein 1, partial [Coemansia helicoidea]
MYVGPSVRANRVDMLDVFHALAPAVAAAYSGWLTATKQVEFAEQGTWEHLTEYLTGHRTSQNDAMDTLLEMHKIPAEGDIRVFNHEVRCAMARANLGADSLWACALYRDRMPPAIANEIRYRNMRTVTDMMLAAERLIDLELRSRADSPMIISAMSGSMGSFVPEHPASRKAAARGPAADSAQSRATGTGWPTTEVRREPDPYWSRVNMAKLGVSDELYTERRKKRRCRLECKLYMPCRVGHEEFAAMVDTGADGNFLSAELAARLPATLQRLATPRVVTDAKGRELARVEHEMCVWLTLADDIRVRTQFFVAPVAARCIVGLPWLQQQGAQLDTASGSLTMVVDGRTATVQCDVPGSTGLGGFSAVAATHLISSDELDELYDSGDVEFAGVAQVRAQDMSICALDGGPGETAVPGGEARANRLVE